MADDKTGANYVESCNLGKFGDGVALKINFAASAAKIKEGPHQSTAFVMSSQVARGLAQALTTILDEPSKPTKN